MNSPNHFLLGIELTRHCNLRCTHCFRANRDQPAELPFEILKDLLSQAKTYNCPSIAFTGGETTLHSRFSDILNLLVSEGFSFHFVTNAFNFQTTFKKLHPLFGNPLWKGVSFSLDGGTEETHDRIRGPNSYARVLGAIAVCKTHNLEVVVQMVAHRENRHELEKIALLVSKMGVNRLYIAHMQPTPFALEKNLLLTPQEMKDVEKEVASLQSQFRIPIFLSAGYYDQTPLAHCRFLQNGTLNIDYQGRLTFCCQISNMEGARNDEDVICDLTKTSLAEAHGKALEAYRKFLQFRLEKMKSQGQDLFDHFHCWTCMKYFHKVDWMRDFPNNEWVKKDAYFQRKT